MEQGDLSRLAVGRIMGGDRPAEQPIDSASAARSQPIAIPGGSVGGRSAASTSCRSPRAAPFIASWTSGRRRRGVGDPGSEHWPEFLAARRRQIVGQIVSLIVDQGRDQGHADTDVPDPVICRQVRNQGHHERLHGQARWPVRRNRSTGLLAVN
jgi:hypothetical protein